MPELIYPLIFLVAMAYSSVGHGGASGYLAVLGLWGFMPKEMVQGALVLNLLVAGIAFVTYWRSGFFVTELFWPFAAASIPAALAGGMVHAPSWIYSSLLAAALVYAAMRLAFMQKKKEGEGVELLHSPKFSVALSVGGGIGFVSGMIGIGGGIFLSPILILSRWTGAKQAAAVSSAFIWVNSAAGLYGQISQKGFMIMEFWPLILPAFMGGMIGSHFGAKRFNSLVLKRMLAVVLMVAVIKIMAVKF